MILLTVPLRRTKVINMPERGKGAIPDGLPSKLCRASEPMVSSLAVQDGVLRLAENVWQIYFRDDPGVFARRISRAMLHRIIYGILQLKDAPGWHPVAFRSKLR